MESTFGERLQALRVRDGETQEDLARAVEVTTSSVSRWERDLGLPRGAEVVALARHFRVTTDHLLLGESNEPRTPVELPDFDRFLQSEYGQVALDRGYVRALLTFAYPTPPNLNYYTKLVRAMLPEGDEKAVAKKPQ